LQLLSFGFFPLGSMLVVVAGFSLLEPKTPVDYTFRLLRSGCRDFWLVHSGLDTPLPVLGFFRSLDLYWSPCGGALDACGDPGKRILLSPAFFPSAQSCGSQTL